MIYIYVYLSLYLHIQRRVLLKWFWEMKWHDWYRSKIFAKKEYHRLFLRYSYQLVQRKFCLRCRRSQAWQRCDSEAQLKDVEDVWRCRSKQVYWYRLVWYIYIYVWLYVRFLKYVSISHIFFSLWAPLVKPQSGVKATLKNIWSQNAKEPGDACRIPRGAWKLHRCIEHATR